MIEIDSFANKIIINDAINKYPEECCGFLFGIEDAGKAIVSDALPVFNSAKGDKKRRFEITSKDYMRAEHHAEKNNFSLLGIYHSHPDHPAIPSEHDRVAAQPFLSYLIISVLNGVETELRSWKLNDECQFVKEKIIIKDLINNKITQ